MPLLLCWFSSVDLAVPILFNFSDQRILIHSLVISGEFFVWASSLSQDKKTATLQKKASTALQGTFAALAKHISHRTTLELVY